MYISCRMRIPDISFGIYCRRKSPAWVEVRHERRHVQNSSIESQLSPIPSNPFSPHPSAKAYLVSLGPPQRKEAGKEELAPADDGSQAPVEASHACVCPVSSASLLSPPSVLG